MVNKLKVINRITLLAKVQNFKVGLRQRSDKSNIGVDGKWNVCSINRVSKMPKEFKIAVAIKYLRARQPSCHQLNCTKTLALDSS